METEREMVDRTINDIKYAIKKNLIVIITLIALIVLAIWLFVKIV